MNPIPPVHPSVPDAVMFANGYLDLLLVLTMASLAIIFGLMLWNVRDVLRERTKIFCPVRLRAVKVVFGLARNGNRTDVLRCSVFGRRPLTCGKACLGHTIGG